MTLPADIDVFQRFMQPNGVVFDIGDSEGDWARELLSRQPGCRIYSGEAPSCASHLPAIHLKLERFLPAKIDRDDNGSVPSLGRNDLASERSQAPGKSSVTNCTLSDFCRIQKITQINILRIVEDEEFISKSIIHDAQSLINRGRINFIIIQNAHDCHGKFYRNAISDYLSKSGYDIYGIDSIFDSPKKGFIAVHGRLSESFLGRPPRMLDVRALLKKHGISPHGVVHVGAFDGKEVELYREVGASSIFLIEANPVLANELHHMYAGSDDVQVAAYAAGESHRTAIFHITSGRQSSSLLTLGRHKDIYPSIVEVEQIEVTVERIDDMITKKGRTASDFNVLNMDIQGAEHLALTGAPELLKHVEAINIEVNFEELYEGCAQIEDIEAILEPAGFHRVAMVCPFHASWGDAFYIRGPTVMKAQGSH